tara:strand:- start:830 stop:985 length:156 start_codon:yes stop_codon:yes gene_type:complete
MKTYFTQGYDQVLVGTISELIEADDVHFESDDDDFTIALYECLIVANKIKG